jgi:hypothetical protein
MEQIERIGSRADWNIEGYAQRTALYRPGPASAVLCEGSIIRRQSLGHSREPSARVPLVVRCQPVAATAGSVVTAAKCVANVDLVG